MIIQAQITNPTRFAEYSARTPLLVESYGGRYLCVGRDSALLEGEFGEGLSVVISVWPSRQDALNFWHSSEYEALKELRAGTGSFNVTLVDDLSALLLKREQDHKESIRGSLLPP